MTDRLSSERRPTYDLLALQRLLEQSDGSSAFFTECDRSICEGGRKAPVLVGNHIDDPVIICDGGGTIVDVHRCGGQESVAALDTLLGRAFESVFGRPVVQGLEEAFAIEPRVTLTAYLFDADGLLLRTEMCCWQLRDSADRYSGMAVMLHDLLAMEEFERRLGARIMHLLEKNLALAGALAGYRAMAR